MEQNRNIRYTGLLRILRDPVGNIVINRLDDKCFKTTTVNDATVVTTDRISIGQKPMMNNCHVNADIG